MEDQEQGSKVKQGELKQNAGDDTRISGPPSNTRVCPPPRAAIVGWITSGSRIQRLNEGVGGGGGRGAVPQAGLCFLGELRPEGDVMFDDDIGSGCRLVALSEETLHSWQPRRCVPPPHPHPPSSLRAPPLKSQSQY